jgi:hypothetical protein
MVRGEHITHQEWHSICVLQVHMCSTITEHINDMDCRHLSDIFIHTKATNAVQCFMAILFAYNGNACMSGQQPYLFVRPVPLRTISDGMSMLCLATRHRMRSHQVEMYVVTRLLNHPTEPSVP